MKKIIFLIALVTLLLGVMPATVSADAWSPTNAPTRFFVSEVANVNAAIGKFGDHCPLLPAYSAIEQNFPNLNEEAVVSVLSSTSSPPIKGPEALAQQEGMQNMQDE